MGSLSPLQHDIPVEILHCIFLLFQEDIELNFNRPERVLHDTLKAVTLAGVCRRWRDTVMSMPSLWSSLSIQYYNCSRFQGDSDGSEILHRLLKFVLARVGDAPLALHFACYERSTVYTDNFNLVLEALCRRASQWKSVQFFTEPSFLRHHAFQLAKENLHSLQYLRIDDSERSQTSGEFYDLDSLGNFPCIRDLSLDIRLLPHSRSLDSYLPWQQLQTLSVKLHIHSRPSPLEFLLMCPGLSSFSFIVEGSMKETTGSHILVGTGVHTFPNLESLSMFAESVLYIPSFLQHITLPRLSSLECHIMRRLEPFEEVYRDAPLVNDNSLFEFLARSSCSITSLTLLEYPISDIELVTLFPLLPHLITLRVTEPQEAWKNSGAIFTRRLFDRLVVKPNSTVEGSQSAQADSASYLLPNLGDLYIIVSKQDLDFDAFFRVVNSRWTRDPESVTVKEGVTRLRTVRVKFLGSPKATWTELKQLIRLERLNVCSPSWTGSLEVEPVV
ncbi:hypothetical protein L218DRAFT_1079464 [Marasmius fiardii PR-910]|nr:hypothetical protein L218DRAFT_1079464 [Marasmius fiardii PR-910]